MEGEKVAASKTAVNHSGYIEIGKKKHHKKKKSLPGKNVYINK